MNTLEEIWNIGNNLTTSDAEKRIAIEHVLTAYGDARYEEGVKCGGFSGEPCEPPASRSLKRLYLTKQAGDDLWHWVGDPIRPTATFDVGLVKISNREEIKVDSFGAYVLRETVAEERKQWRDEIEALVEKSPSGARVINCYPEILVAIVEKALTEREEEMVEPVAKAIYNQMSYYEDGIKPEWVVGGNSLKQDEARRIAQKALTEYHQQITP